MPQNNARLRKDRVASKAKDGRLLTESGAAGPVAFISQTLKRVKPKIREATPDVKTAASSDSVGAEPITLLIAQNPEMNASTFLNLLKSKGFVITPPQGPVLDKKESDTASANPQALRKESTPVTFRTRKFLESQVQVDKNKGGATKYNVVLLEEGMGNFGASAYYSKEALQSAIPIFEGKKIYADHPAESEAEERPERSVRDILGHFENIKTVESQSGQTLLTGDVVVMGGPSAMWARELMQHAVEYSKKFPDKEFVGLSINASGDSEPKPIEAVMKQAPQGALQKMQEAQKQGISEVTYVSKFNEAVSCDLVTEAGAGGKILSLIEGSKIKNKKGDSMDPKQKEAADKAAKEAAAVTDKKEADGNEGKDQSGNDDAAQDAELIKSMMDKHMKGEQVSEEEAAIVKEAYEAHKEMGLEAEEAGAKACEYLKASKHMAAKREAAAAASKDAPAGDAGSEDDKKDEQKESEEQAGKESSVKESNKKASPKDESTKLKEENLKLQGELAAFKESQRKQGLQTHIEKICKESKLHTSTTASFKEKVKDAKSVEEVDKAWSIFQEGYRANKSKAAGSLDFGTMMIESEKAPGDSGSGSGIDFSACQIEE